MNTPVTPTETLVASVWRELLEVDRVDPTEDFFALGGHSLLAVQVVQELYERTNLPIELEAFFDLGTVRGVAAELDRLRAAGGEAAEVGVYEGEL